jgi:hypothetical protein
MDTKNVTTITAKFRGSKFYQLFGRRGIACFAIAAFYTYRFFDSDSELADLVQGAEDVSKLKGFGKYLVGGGSGNLDAARSEIARGNLEIVKLFFILGFTAKPLMKFIEKIMDKKKP